MAAEDEYNNTQQEMNAVTIVFIKLKWLSPLPT
jgi:hypothetical protein